MDKVLKPLSIAFLCLIVILVIFAFKDLLQAREVSIVTPLGEAIEESTIYVNVDLSGAVNSPGVYRLSSTALVGDLIAKGGGFNKDVDLDWVNKSLNLAETVEDGKKLYIPYYWEQVQRFEINLASENSAESNYNLDAKASLSADLINVNSTDQTSLTALPGIGPAYAGRIIANAPYTDFEDMISRSEVPQSTLEKVRESLVF